MYSPDTQKYFASNFIVYHYEVEIFSALLVLCEGYSSVTDGLSTENASNVELWYFLCSQSIAIAEQTGVLPVTWEATTALWHHSLSIQWLILFFQNHLVLPDSLISP